MRSAEITRKTEETEVAVSLALDGTGRADVASGCGFLDHMLTLLARHGRFDLTLRCAGDTGVDDHHSVEDCGICLGQAFTAALGDKRGVARYGQSLLPMDETLVLCAVDLSGRSFLGWRVTLPAQKVGSFDTELVREFFLAFVRCCPAAVHLRLLEGENTHHIIEALFKAAGRALGQAAALDPRLDGAVLSTKGTL